jgi:hypothetical protein
MTGTASRKRTTLADLNAAAALGGIDPDTAEVILASELDAVARETAGDILSEIGASDPAAALPSTAHACGIPGCRHGAGHSGDHTPQPDRQVKLACPTCGAVARMTARALQACGGIDCANDSETFVVTARRQYNRKGGAA